METATTTNDISHSERFGRAMLWGKRDGQWVAFMRLPVRHAAEVATAWRSEGREARVTF